MTDVETFCPGCDYNLRGLESGHCPECGLEIDRSRRAQSRLPWEHRVRIGRVRAYWRTNRLVLLRPRRLAEEIDRPVDFGSARRFRQATALLGFLPLLGVGIWLYGWSLGLEVNWPVRPVPTPPGAAQSGSTTLGWVLEGLTLAATAMAVWIVLLGGAGVGSYFFHPRSLPVERQNRAVALSYYACAPLAWIFVPVLLGAVGMIITATHWYEHFSGRFAAAGSWIVAGLAALLLLGFWWLRTVLLLRRTTGCRKRRVVGLGVFLPVAWILLVAIGSIIPLAAAFVSLVVLSLR